MFNYVKKTFSINKNPKNANEKVSSNNDQRSLTDEKANKTKVICDENGLSIDHTNGSNETVIWTEITKVSVISTNKGPNSDDIFLVLYKGENRFIVPYESVGCTELYWKVSKLEGFNHQKYFEAMSSKVNREFICWETT